MPIVCFISAAGFQAVYKRMQPPEPLVAANFDRQEEKLAQKLLSNRYISLLEDAGPDGSNAIRVSYQGFERGSKRVTVSRPLPRA